MADRFVFCSAAAGGSRQCRPSIRKKSCGFAEISRFNLWRLISSPEPAAASACRLSLPITKNLEALIYGRQIRVLFGGSRWESAMPTLNPQAGLVDSQTLAASIYGGQWSSIECAAASGSRPCRPAASACRLSLPDLSLPGAGARARSGSAGGAWSRCRFCRCTRRSRPD